MAPLKKSKNKTNNTNKIEFSEDYDVGYERAKKAEEVATDSTNESECTGEDTPQEPSIAIIDDEQESGKQPSLEGTFLTPMIIVYVGPESLKFLAHIGVLEKSSVLAKLIGFGKNVYLDDDDPLLFEMLLRHLYGLSYDDHTTADFQTHVHMYTLALRFNLTDLAEEAIRKAEVLKEIEFRSLVKISEKIYPQLPADELWFNEHLKHEAAVALLNDAEILKQPYLLEVIGSGGRLATDIFTAVAAHLHTIINGPCMSRPYHMFCMKQDNSWADCNVCREDRDRINVICRETVSVELRRVLRTSRGKRFLGTHDNIKLKSRTLIDKVVMELMDDDFQEHGIDQAEHLVDEDGQCKWKTCQCCVRDRDQLLLRLRQLPSTKALFESSILAPEAVPSVACGDDLLFRSQEVREPAEQEFWEKVDPCQSPVPAAFDGGSTVLDSTICPSRKTHMSHETAWQSCKACCGELRAYALR